MLTLSSVLTSLNLHAQVIFSYFSLYLVALAQGCFKPSVQALGADQFDENNPEESIARSSFFNWRYFGIAMGTVSSVVTLSYIQVNVRCGFGFGIPCILLAAALVVFLLGTRTYRSYQLTDENPFGKVCRAFAALARSRRNSGYVASLNG